ncbi:MAG TPA: DUF3857 domain-containing protein [Puia sp.]|nr:DUF3857 domain-containing protein [Puia sp.]
MKNKQALIFLYVFSWAFLLGSASSAQSLDSIRKKFPDEKAVMLNKILGYTIDVKDGRPHVESDESEQIEYLSSASAAFLSDFGFYHSSFQKLVSYQAYTQTPNEKKIKVSEFKTNTTKESFVFYDDFKETSFNFPSAGPGAIGNLRVSWQNTDPHLLSPFYFSNYIPVLNSELKVTCSKDISLKYIIMGLDSSKVTVNIENKRKYTIYTFQYKDCPAEKSYADAPNSSWYSTHVIFYIEKYKDENGAMVPFLSSLQDLYKLSYSYIKPINSAISPELKNVVDSLTANEASMEAKARKIYFWVQQHIKYVAFEEGMEGFVPRDASVVCNRRFGDCKDMTSILTMMMKVAGVPAYFTWIGSRSLPYKFSEVPLPLVSNHMICTIMLNGDYIFLDGTDPTCVFGKPSYSIQDKEAMIAINENEYKILKVPIIEKSNNRLIDTTWIGLTEKTIRGKIKKELKGYFSMHEYGKLMYADRKDAKDNMKEEFQRGSNKFQLDTFDVKKGATTDDITLYADFTLLDFAKKIGSEYYLNLNLFKFYEHEEIDYPKRKMPIEYNFVSERRYTTVLNIPQGYKVSYLPASKSYHNKVWGFDIKYVQKGDQVIMTQEFDNDHLMITKEDFESWNKVLENLFPLYKETLSLSKN